MHDIGHLQHYDGIGVHYCCNALLCANTRGKSSRLGRHTSKSHIPIARTSLKRKQMIVAMIFSTALLGLIIGQVSYGAGRHAAYIIADNPEDFVNGMRLNFISQPVTILGVTFIKASVAVFLLRLAPPVKYIIFIWCVVAFMCIYTIVGISECRAVVAVNFADRTFQVTVFLQCTPLRGIWDSNISTKCMTRTALLVLSYTHQCTYCSAYRVFVN